MALGALDAVSDLAQDNGQNARPTLSGKKVSDYLPPPSVDDSTEEHDEEQDEQESETDQEIQPLDEDSGQEWIFDRHCQRGDTPSLSASEDDQLVDSDDSDASDEERDPLAAAGQSSSMAANVKRPTALQYNRLLSPLQFVIKIIRGIPPTFTNVNFKDEPLQLPELKATMLVLALLGSRMKAVEVQILLCANLKMLMDPTVNPVARVPSRPVSIQNRPHIARRKLILKRRSLYSYWNNICRGLVAKGVPELKREWKLEMIAFLDELRMEDKKPPVKITATHSMLRALHTGQAVASQPNDSENDEPQAKASGPSHLTRLMTGQSGPQLPATAVKTLDQSINELPDPAAALRKTAMFVCPLCDLDCKTYPHLLFHWISIACKKRNGTNAERRVWCNFCHCFLSLQGVPIDALIQHKSSCAYQWGLSSGFSTAVLSKKRNYKKSKKRKRDPEVTGVFASAPHSDLYRPCAFTVPNFFSLKSATGSKIQSVTWYFCPDCSGHRCAVEKTRQKPEMKKMYAVFRTPIALAQHYQDHLTRSGRKLGGKHLPVNQSYDPAWPCTFPACLYTAKDLKERLNHLSKEHMIPLLVNGQGKAVLQGEFRDDVKQVKWWSTDEYQDVHNLFLTRGKNDMQSGRRWVNAEIEAEQDAEGETDSEYEQEQE
ncbi:unnamed protein product [Sympodiomycopsis kandeliae]